MARKPIFSDFQVREMKELIRTGEPIMMLAERLAVKYNVPEQSMRNKLYNVARRTYKIADWNGPKRRSTKKFEPSTVAAPVSVIGGRIERYDDHIRIYF